jgi:hypothetical protein
MRTPAWCMDRMNRGTNPLPIRGQTTRT